MLTADSLYVSYGKIEVLRGLSFAVEEREIVGVLGPNGCGKSTALKAISGLLTPIGKVLYRDRDVTTAGIAERVRSGITLVPQGKNVFASMTVQENFLMGAFCRSDKAGVAEDCEFWFRFFPQLADKRHRLAGQLSGGEQRMVAIARGLMARPSLLLLDEPSLGVAPVVLAELGRGIRRLREELGLTIVIVEQDVPFALEIADRILVLAGGKVALDAPPSELHDGERLRDVYFGRTGAIPTGS
jgi:branched-chain amino acid transport system ATP-binding protein